jgi:hypothetical protein
MSKSYTLDVQQREDGELYLEFPDEILEEAGWKIGDTLKWKDNGDGSFTLTKKETEWVLVDCVSTFRQRYLVEVPRGKTLWAEDTVAMKEAKEFSQRHLGEQIVSHRVVDREAALAMCRVDNAYAASWSDDQLMEAFSTPWAEDEGESDRSLD